VTSASTVPGALACRRASTLDKQLFDDLKMTLNNFNQADYKSAADLYYMPSQ
jgi:hypothetical protein